LDAVTPFMIGLVMLSPSFPNLVTLRVVSSHNEKFFLLQPIVIGMALQVFLPLFFQAPLTWTVGHQEYLSVPLPWSDKEVLFPLSLRGLVMKRFFPRLNGVVPPLRERRALPFPPDTKGACDSVPIDNDCACAFFPQLRHFGFPPF